MENEQLLAVYADTGSARALDEIVRRNQNLNLIVFEFFESALALALRFVAVNGFGFEAAGDEFF